MQLDTLKLRMMLRCNHINRSYSLNEVTLKFLDHQVLSSEMCEVMVPLDKTMTLIIHCSHHLYSHCLKAYI